MSEDADYLFALKLQQELNGDATEASDPGAHKVSGKNNNAINTNENSNLNFQSQL